MTKPRKKLLPRFQRIFIKLIDKNCSRSFRNAGWRNQVFVVAKYNKIIGSTNVLLCSGKLNLMLTYMLQKLITIFKVTFLHFNFCQTLLVVRVGAWLPRTDSNIGKISWSSCPNRHGLSSLLNNIVMLFGTGVRTMCTTFGISLYVANFWRRSRLICRG